MQIIIVNVALIGKMFDRNTLYQVSGESRAFFVNISLLSKQKIEQFFFILFLFEGIETLNLITFVLKMCYYWG